VPGPLNANELLPRDGFQELWVLAAAITSHRNTLNDRNCSAFNVETESDKDGETQEEVRTCRMQQDVSASWWIYVADVELTIFN